MDISADGHGPVAVEPTAGEINHQESSRVRRRMVQSTLIPHKSPPIESKGEQKKVKNCNGADKDGDEDECCGSQGIKKRTRKRKESPQTKTPRASKKGIQASPEVNSEKDATPKKSTPKGTTKKNGTPRKTATPKKNSTPRKNGTTNGKIAQLVEDGDVPKIPNLRLEAKLMAEENSRVFGGKQIHPFFLLKNVSSKCDDKAIQGKAKSITVGPIHVFDREQDNAEPLDWRNWKFSEEPFYKSSHTQKSAFSSIFECTVKALEFDQFSNLSDRSGRPLLQDNMSLDECQQESFQASATAVSSNVLVECCQHVANTKSESQINEQDPGIVRKSDEQAEFLQERFMSSHLACSNQFDNRLWTDKYQPKKATEICGNDDSVKFLSEWLQTWSQRGQKENKDSSGCDVQDPDYDNFQWDSDSEDNSKETGIKNVLLITGPAGSGKSAAIYACAKEQGFRVLEASASECRNGAALRDRFGVLESQATLDSQLFQWSQESSIEFQSMDVTNSVDALSNGKISQQLGSVVNEAIPISDEDISSEATETTEKSIYKENAVVCGQGRFKPLFLFEDVDIVFPEDRGFVSAIQQIADRVKWPVILTSNSDKPLVPDSLDKLEVSFKMPLGEELLQQINTVCAAEKVNVQPYPVEQLIEYCEKDIRKTIMHLQFWCQGEQFRKGEVKRLSALPSFELEAGYQMLPKMIPWDFPSQLSELVEKEITISLCMMEENSNFKAAREDKLDSEMMQENFKKRICDPDSIKAKKKAMLSKNCSQNDCIDFVGRYDTTSDLFDLPSSPLPYSEKSGRRKLVVMSSDSEDEFLKDRVPATPDENASNKLSLEVDGGFLSHHPCGQPSTDLVLCSGVEKLEENPYKCSEAAKLTLPKSLNPLTELQLFSGSDKLENNYQFPETTIDLNVKDTCVSVDVSCVPESSFVPETVINDGTKALFGRISFGQADQEAENVEEASVSNEFRQTLFPAEADDFDESMTELCKNYDLVGVNSTLPHEEADDSLYELGESIMREPQLMDECSCIDFSRKFMLQVNSRSSTTIDTVQNSWRRLRNQHADLKKLVASEDKSSSETMKLALGISHLISEAELLRAKCQSLDSLGLPVMSSEDTNASSWSDEQMQMASAILQHGFCLYAKDIASLGLNISSDSRVGLISDVPSSASKASNIGLLENGLLPNSECESHFASIVRSMVPSRAYMSIKGYALCEYLSSLGQILRSESTRLSDDVDNTRRRRGRASRNYLSSGSLMLSAEEISLLGQSNIYGLINKNGI